MIPGKQSFLMAILLYTHHFTVGDDFGDDLPEVRHLLAEPDFRDVRLRWESDRHALGARGFLVHYCELQAWGPHRCKAKVVDEASGVDGLNGSGQRVRIYAVTVAGLRMATNYTLEVRPVEASPSQQLDPGLPKALGKSVVVPTRGFSARATLCLPEASEVEVTTGPGFGGRIAAEDAPACSVDGDPLSPRDTYLLRLDHARCGGLRNASAVATYVTVQESLAILTHSTRRFLVVCSFQPETLTVRAGISLPSSGAKQEVTNNKIENVMSDILPYDVDGYESVNDVRVSHLQHHRQLVDSNDDVVPDQSAAQLVLMVILVVAGVVGFALTAWWFAPGLRKRVSGQSSDHDSASVSIYENFENSVRDTMGHETSDDRVANPCAGLPQEVLNETLCCSADDDQAEEENIFTIRIPVTTSARNQSQADRPCITIERPSHSEA